MNSVGQFMVFSMRKSSTAHTPGWHVPHETRISVSIVFFNKSCNIQRRSHWWA